MNNTDDTENVDEFLDMINDISEEELKEYREKEGNVVAVDEEVPKTLDFLNDVDSIGKKPNTIYICVCKQKRIFKSGLLLKYKMIKDKYGVVKSRSGAIIKILNISYKVKEPEEGWDNFNSWKDEMLKKCKDAADNQKEDSDNKEDIIQNIIPKKPEDVNKEELAKIIYNALQYMYTRDSSFDDVVKKGCEYNIELINKEFGAAIEHHYSQEEFDEIQEKFNKDKEEENYVL